MLGWFVGSSPRERGSSFQAAQPGLHGAVVPARAGVIRSRRDSRPPTARRPRASGGHPRHDYSSTMDARSSPRERGSSQPLLRDQRCHSVVPARAGVIPGRVLRPRVAHGRPRASGGHPSQEWVVGAVIESSPRERGSSPTTTADDVLRHVVPARAGVILQVGRRVGLVLGRPRASGGHPEEIIELAGAIRSSPRERGSSGHRGQGRGRRQVVPARAGVIRIRWTPDLYCPCRPRASGGHPIRSIVAWSRSSSSPRERGSSDQVDRRLVQVLVVPARAGVIPRWGTPRSAR